MTVGAEAREPHRKFPSFVALYPILSTEGDLASGDLPKRKGKKKPNFPEINQGCAWRFIIKRIAARGRGRGRGRAAQKWAELQMPINIGGR